MSADLIRAAQSEAAKLRLSIQAYTRKLETLEAVLREFANDSGDAVGDLETGGSTRVEKQRSRDQTPKLSVPTLAEKLFRETGQRAQTNAIVEYVRAAGFVFKSNDPVGAVSSALSHHPAFDNKRPLGYGLKEWGGADGAPHPSSGPGGYASDRPVEATPESADADKLLKELEELE